MASELLKKITMKAIGLDGDTLLRCCIDKNGDIVAVARVYGRARHAKSELSNYGPYVLFKGGFEAVNLLNTKSFKSGLLILQGPTEGILEGAVGLAGENGEVPFVMEIGVKYDASAASKYVFTGKLIGEEQTNMNDPLADLRALAMGEAPKAISGKKEKQTA